MIRILFLLFSHSSLIYHPPPIFFQIARLFVKRVGRMQREFFVNLAASQIDRGSFAGVPDITN
jgi:hypothetical protein